MFGESLGTNLGEKGMHHALVSHKTSNEGSTMDCMVLLSNKTSNEGSTMDCMVLPPPSLLQGEPLNKTSNEAGYIRLDRGCKCTSVHLEVKNSSRNTQSKNI